MHTWFTVVAIVHTDLDSLKVSVTLVQGDDISHDIGPPTSSLQLEMSTSISPYALQDKGHLLQWWNRELIKMVRFEFM